MIDLERHDGVSRLELGRMSSGELPRAHDERLAAFEREVAAEPLPAFDFAALRAASHRVEEPPAERPPDKAPWWRGVFAVLVPLTVAALAMVAIRSPEPGTHGTKGHADLDFFVDKDGEVRPGVDGETLAPGDRVQFSYRADGLDSLVIVNVDGTGTITVFFPEDEQGPPGEVIPGGRQLLDFSVALDDAPGPEVFVGVFGVGSVGEAVDLVELSFEGGGHAALLELPLTDDAVDVVRVEKSP